MQAEAEAPRLGPGQTECGRERGEVGVSRGQRWGAGTNRRMGETTGPCRQGERAGAWEVASLRSVECRAGGGQGRRGVWLLEHKVLRHIRTANDT